MSIKPRTIPSKILSQNLASDGLTMYLNNTEDWDGAQLSSSDFGTQLFAILRNSNNTQLEIVEIDPASVTSAATLTILKRALGFDGTQVANTETAYNWLAFDTYVELGADTPQLLKQLVEETTDETIAGVKTFSSIPKTTGGNPVADNDLVRKAYADALVLGNLTTINVIVPGTAGATIADGDLIYFDDTDNEWKLCDADTAATVNNVMLGIAQGAGTDGNAITNGVLLQGVDDAQSGLTNGQTYYASNTAGDISSTPGTTEVTIGIGKSATELYFKPRFDQMITEDQQDALAGTSGTPSSTNKYVTNDDTTGTGSLVRKSFIRFGGTGADGALSITSGTTTIDLGGARIVVKNYTSISITGTGVLAFSNPHSDGTLVILKSQGGVTITSSATRAIDLRSMGGAGGAGGTANGGDGGNGGSPQATIISPVGGLKGTGGTNAARTHSSLAGVGTGIKWITVNGKAIQVGPGGGGGGGGGGFNSGGGSAGSAGGRGGGGLFIECAGALNFTGTIDASGANGTAGTAGSYDGGAGGGGGGGSVVILYNTLTSSAGTITTTGGNGGNSASGGYTGGAGGAGGNGLGTGNGGDSGTASHSQQLIGVAGGGGSACGGGTNGSNGGGTAGNGAGGGGAGGGYLVAENTDYV